MNSPCRRFVIRPPVALAALGVALVLPWLAGATPAVAAAPDEGEAALAARLDAALRRFPALLSEGSTAGEPVLTLIPSLPPGVEGPAGLAARRVGTPFQAVEPREEGPMLIAFESAPAQRASAGRAPSRLMVTRRIAAGAAPQEAVVISSPVDAPRAEVVQLALDARASAVEVWRVEADGSLSPLLAAGRAFGGRSLYLEAEPGGLYVVTLSFPWE